jgi:hypothetical protein
LDAFLSPWTLLIKALGLALAVASGLSLGKEVWAHPLLYILKTSCFNPRRDPLYMYPVVWRFSYPVSSNSSKTTKVISRLSASP